MKKCFAAMLCFAMILSTASCKNESVETLTYAVFPYLPDTDYYQQLIESRWAELEPDIQLIRKEWDCYSDGEPEGIDVIIYDAVMQDTIIDAGWIQPIDSSAVQESDDYFQFALEGVTVKDKLYGIPVFLCGNFLIYDRECPELAKAEHITDLADESDILVMNFEDSVNRPQYIIEVIADVRGEANPSVNSGAEEIIPLIDRLVIEDHKNDTDAQVAMAYDSGIGQGYIGFSESMRFLKKRFAETDIKTISFSDKENVPRMYADAIAVTANAKGLRYKKSLELINVMSDAQVLTDLSMQDGNPQYLMLARKSPYQLLSDKFPIYKQMECLAANEMNHVILTK